VAPLLLRVMNDTPWPKRIELAWRAFWIRVLTRAMRKPARGESLQWDRGPHRVLFLRHDRIGDMILSTGVLRAIAQSHASVALDVLASPGNAPVLRAEPYVNDVVVFDRRRVRSYPALIRRLRAKRYDAVIDCMVTAPSLTTSMLMWASGARHRIGIRGRGNDEAFSLTVPQRPHARHIAEHLATLAAAFGVDPDRTDAATPALHLGDDERRAASARWPAPPGAPRLLVNVSAGRTFRRWPVERFVAAIDHVRARLPQLGAVVIGAPDEWSRVEAVARDTGATPVRTAGIRDAFALVATSDLVFTPDTSIAHAASAFHKPAVAMYVPGTTERWGLYGTWGRNVESPDGTLESLEVETVIAALDDIIDQWRARAPTL
jgi:ADP-heptose:LPS heptosyltransferase